MAARASRSLARFVDRFPNHRVLVLGDLMLDHYIRGIVRRISPEAPVPVVRVSAESSMPGGAGNVANNLAALGAKVAVLGVVGKDGEGQLFLDVMNRMGVDAHGVIRDPERPTTQKVRIIAEHQQIVRFDREKTAPLSGRVIESLRRAVENEIPRCDAVLLSDYGKGVLTPAVMRAALKAAAKAGVPVTVDPKPEHFKLYKGVRCLTPNLQEAFAGMGRRPRDSEEDIESLGRAILKSLKAEAAIVTRGEKGMSLFEGAGRGRVLHIPTVAKEVFDVTGAGDTVIATLTLALCSGARLADAAFLANAAAGVTVGKLGAATVSREELKASLGGRR